MIYQERLKSIRERIGLTKIATANILDIDQSLYIKYEKELYIIPIKHLNTLCNNFKISLDYIFNFTEIKCYRNTKKDIDSNLSGIRLKEFRKENKLTQKKLADKLNIANTMLSEYELGHFLISTHALYDICKKYNISADYLLGKTDKPKYLK